MKTHITTQSPGMATCVLVAGMMAGMLLAGCQNGSARAWGTGIGAAAGAGAGYLLAGDSSGTEGALIGALVGGGAGYLVGSHLDKQDQRKVVQEYNHLMQMDDRESVEARIRTFADSELGNADGNTSAKEYNRALNELGHALDTAADESGDRNRSTSPLERQRYVQRHQDRPLVQILTGT